MANNSYRQRQTHHAQQRFNLIARLDQANLLEMSEEEFHRLITDIEKSSLFKKLQREQKIIRYARVPGTDIASGFYQLKPEIAADQGSLDTESLMVNKEYVVRQIQELGLEKFKQYFLYPEPDIDVQQIAQECDLDLDEVQKIIDMIDEFSILSEFYHPSTSGTEQRLYYSKIASIERGPEGFVIGFFSPSFARGKYDIDYEGFDKLRRNGNFTDAEIRDARLLLKKLEMVNVRKNTVSQILRGIVEKQALYFESGDLKALLPFSQKEMAKELELVPSSASRTISGKSIETPWNEEIPLKDFFPRPSSFRKNLLRQLLEVETDPLSDETIRNRLQREFGVHISRRSVARLRSDLRIPPAWQRRKSVSES